MKMFENAQKYHSKALKKSALHFFKKK